MTEESNSMQVKKKIENLLEQVRDFSLSKPARAKELSENIIRLARGKGLKHQQAAGLIWYSHLDTVLVGSLEAIDKAREAVDLLSDSIDKSLLARAYNVLGNCLNVQLNLSEALEQYQNAMDVYKEIEDYKRRIHRIE